MNICARLALPAAFLGLLAATQARAADPPAATAPARTDCAIADTGLPSPSIAASLPAALADPGGLRAAWGQRGVQFGLNYIGEVLGNPRGGQLRGTIYDGRVELTVDACLEKLVGWQGAAFHANAYQIHGAGLSRYYVGNIFAASYIEALTSTRLYEAWIEQKLFDGKIAVKAGQLGADGDFLVTSYGQFLINSTTGWPAIFASNMPSGGPSYPLATPGVRVKFQPAGALAVLGGIYNGDPSGPGANDPQSRNRNGTNFRLRGKPLLMGEVQYQYKLGPDLPGTVKAGAWRHFGTFNDLRFRADGLSLADPASNGIARQHKGDYGVYAMVDQLVWHVPGADAANGIGFFSRISGNPSQQNLISFYADAGLNFKGVFAARPNDVFGGSVAYARASRQARGLDFDNISFNGGSAVRDYELGVELSYVAQVAVGWTIQPDVQFLFHPGLHAANPRDPAGNPPKNAVVVGMRSTINY